eukprot:15089698-Heterocapsa_arctica.AAC.1
MTGPERKKLKEERAGTSILTREGERAGTSTLARAPEAVAKRGAEALPMDIEPIVVPKVMKQWRKREEGSSGEASKFRKTGEASEEME